MEENEKKRQDTLNDQDVPYRVLVVDDSAIIRKIIRKILTSQQYEICGEAEDGDQVLDLYKELQPDVVTLDINMIKVDGIAALKRILDYDSNARVVMLTAAEDKKAIIEAVSLGAKGYIVKPPSPDKVLEKIKNALQG